MAVCLAIEEDEGVIDQAPAVAKRESVLINSSDIHDARPTERSPRNQYRNVSDLVDHHVVVLKVVDGVSPIITAYFQA